MTPRSVNLRLRIVEAYLGGITSTYAETAELFGVGEATVSPLELLPNHQRRRGALLVLEQPHFDPRRLAFHVILETRPFIYYLPNHKWLARLENSLACLSVAAAPADLARMRAERRHSKARGCRTEPAPRSPPAIRSMSR